MTVEYLKVLPAMAEEMQHPNGAAALSKKQSRAAAAETA
jgi:hypothetical protein